MRMWGVNPGLLCNKHLLGEHVEMHMFCGTILKNKSIQGYLDNGLVDPCKISARHEDLVYEMERRGMNHKSPIQFNSCHLSKHQIDIGKSMNELSIRCEECKKLIQEYLLSGGK